MLSATVPSPLLMRLVSLHLTIDSLFRAAKFPVRWFREALFNELTIRGCSADMLRVEPRSQSDSLFFP